MDKSKHTVTVPHGDYEEMLAAYDKSSNALINAAEHFKMLSNANVAFKNFDLTKFPKDVKTSITPFGTDIYFIYE